MGKKILYIAPSDIHIKSFHMPYLKYLKENEYEIDIVTNSNKKIDYCEKKYKIDFNIKSINKLKQIMTNKEYNIIHCHTEKVSIITRLAYKKAKLKNTKLIYTTHGFNFYKNSNKILYLIEKYLAKYTDILITMNKEDYEIAKNFKTDVRYIKGIGLNQEKYNKKLTEEEKLNLRKELNLKSTDFIMIYPSELTKNKNQKLLIQIMTELDKKIKLILPGKDSNKGKYQKLVKKLNLEDRIQFLGFRDDIEKLIQISDLEISTSKNEGLPVNIMEAMYMKVPIVATNCKGNRDLIKNDINGYLVEIDDKKDLIDKITFIYKNRKFGKNLGCNNEKYITEYLLEKTMKEFIEIYKGV